MGEVESRLAAAGLVLPAAFPAPPGGLKLPFATVLRVGSRLLISGHGPQGADGEIDSVRGKLGVDLSVEQGYRSARLVALSMLGSIRRELGSLDRVSRWVRVFGMVNSGPNFVQQPAVINGFSDLILELWGPQRGAHVRSAVGMAQLPFDMPVEIEAEVALGDPLDD